MKFVTLFINCPNIGLVKDVGQIPYHLSKKENVIATLVSGRLNMRGPFIENVKGTQLENVPMIGSDEAATGVRYLFHNSRKVDCLNLYHCRTQTYIWARIYKLLNPKGLLYIKLDAGFKTVEDIKQNTKYRKLFCKLAAISDVMSAESQITASRLSDIAGHDVLYIPNGADMVENIKTVGRDNMFLTVARIGSPEKNNDILLEAFAEIADKCDWDMTLVGGIEEGFKTYIDEYFHRYPELESRVHFAGQVNDRDELNQFYQSSKVFVLPSQFESFSIAAVEALMNGDYLVLSDQVTPKDDFTNGGKYGCVAKTGSVSDLAEKMLMAAKQTEDPEIHLDISKYASENFSWERICDSLYEILINKRGV